MAETNMPRSIAFDSIGHLYIADYAYHRIRKVLACIKLGFIPSNYCSGTVSAVDSIAISGDMTPCIWSADKILLTIILLLVISWDKILPWVSWEKLLWVGNLAGNFPVVMLIEVLFSWELVETIFTHSHKFRHLN